MDKQTFELRLEQLLAESLDLIPKEQLPARPYHNETDTGWYDFELTLWAKGEELRQLLLTSGRTLSDGQAQAVLAICLEPKAMRGRQSFLLLLGRKRHAVYANAVVGLLSDPYVAGHAIDVLYKMRVPSYCREIEPFTHHEITWIRNSAKRYLQKYA